MPRIIMYLEDKTRVHVISNTMSRDTFVCDEVTSRLCIMIISHTSTNDTLWKLRPYMHIMWEGYLKLEIPFNIMFVWMNE